MRAERTLAGRKNERKGNENVKNQHNKVGKTMKMHGRFHFCFFFFCYIFLLHFLCFFFCRFLPRFMSLAIIQLDVLMCPWSWGQATQYSISISLRCSQKLGIYEKLFVWKLTKKLFCQLSIPIISQQIYTDTFLLIIFDCALTFIILNSVGLCHFLAFSKMRILNDGK